MRATEGGTVSRDARSGAASRRIPPAARREKVASAPSVRRSATSGGAPEGGETVVVGAVPPSARLAGGLLVLAALLGIAALFPTYLVVGGRELDTVTGPGSALVGLLVPVASAAVGVVLLRGDVPKFGLAYAGVAGALAVGQLLIEIYRGSSSTTRPGIEVIAGVRVLTSSVAVGAGWWLGVAALALPAADVPDQLVTDPSTGLVTVVTTEGPQALLERPGLALLGGLLLAGAVVLCSVIAPSLRPRLATVGGLLAISVAVLAAGLTGLREAVASRDLEWTVPGAALLLAGIGYALLTVLAWRLRRSRA